MWSDGSQTLTGIKSSGGEFTDTTTPEFLTQWVLGKVQEVAFLNSFWNNAEASVLMLLVQESHFEG